MNKNATIVTFNAGSSSMKFGLYSITDKNLKCITQGGIFNLDSQAIFETQPEKENHNLPQIKNHQQATAYLLNWLQQHFPDTNITAAGHRVVHGGCEFTHPIKLDNVILKKLHDFTHLAPLHMPQNLRPIKSIKMKTEPNSVHPTARCLSGAFLPTKSL